MCFGRIHYFCGREQIPKPVSLTQSSSHKVKAPLDKVILGIDPGTNMLGYGVIHIMGHKVIMQAMGVIDLRRCGDGYLKLGRIYERVRGIITEYMPDEMAIESPFCGKNVQSMLKLGRAQGVSIAAAISRDVPIHEYAPLKIKQAITGNGGASKEQVAGMLQRILSIPEESMLPYLDATDALGAAYCHYVETMRPGTSGFKGGTWKDFVRKNSNRVSGGTDKPLTDWHQLLAARDIRRR